MLTIEVNNRPIEAKPGEMLLSAMRRAGIRVPTLCHVEQLTPTGRCRLCVVEVAGQPNLVPSCAFPVTEGLKVQTHSPRAVRARKTIVELLLASHPDDCLYCTRNNDCTLQALAAELGVRERRYFGTRPVFRMDGSSASIVRDSAKCVLCGKCVRMCGEIQGVAALNFTHRGSRTRVGTAFDLGLNLSGCVECGQCIQVCPTGALREQSHVIEVLDALNNPKRRVVVQYSPAVPIALAEEFGLRPGADAAGIVTAVLRRLGFDEVFKTAFAADLAAMELAAELLQRLETGGPLPLLTSCSPAWVKYVEAFQPEFIPHLSTCKSPQQMLGALIKRHLAVQRGDDASAYFSVAVVPCTARKFEAARAELSQDGIPDIDAVLTTRELVEIIRLRGVNPRQLEPETADHPFHESSSAGRLFGVAGGVAEAVLRAAHRQVGDAEPEAGRFKGLRGHDELKRVAVELGGRELNVAAVSGLGNARSLLDQIRASVHELHFVEVMACPGGCVSGGGQPASGERQTGRSRGQVLYTADRDARLRTADGNQALQQLYADLLGAPLSPKCQDLLHTHYRARALVH